MRALAVGVGCRKGCTAADIVAAVNRALGHAAGRMAEPPVVAALFTVVDKQGEPGLTEAAAELGLPLVYLPRASLEARAPEATTRSERVVALFGVPSVAETAALAGAGPHAVLVVPRLVQGGATCAVAGPSASQDSP